MSILLCNNSACERPFTPTSTDHNFSNFYRKRTNNTPQLLVLLFFADILRFNGFFCFVRKFPCELLFSYLRIKTVGSNAIFEALLN